MSAETARRLKRSAKIVIAVVAVSAITSVAPGTAAEPTCGPQLLYAKGPMSLPKVSPSSVVTPGTTVTGVGAGYFTSLPPDTWGATASATQISWYLDGLPVSSAGQPVRSAYQVKQADIGRTLTQVATVQWATECRQDYVSAAAPPVEVKAVSSVKVARGSASVGQRPKVRVRVSQQGKASERGFVQITWKGPERGSVIVAVRSRGKATATLPRLPKGTYRVTAKFTDTSGHALDSKSRVAKLRVG